MKVLVVGGTGLIGAGIVKALFARGANVTVYSRGHRESDAAGAAGEQADRITGDRSDPWDFERTFERSRYDVVIDMICFDPEQAESTVRAFGGRCEHLLFCSTVCTYGAKVPPCVLIDEGFPQEPVTAYGHRKLACERVFERAAQRGRFNLTVLRPSHTYGPGGPLIDQLEFDSGTWDRVARGLPILCAGDGLGLWQSTHRDDCGKLFAHAALDSRTYGEAYNAARDDVFTWRDYYRQAAAALGTRAKLVFAPASWLLRERPARFRFLNEVTRFHGAYSSAKAKAHVPAFAATVGFEAGARQTFADVRRRHAWRDSRADEDYQRLVDQALSTGFEVVEA